MTDLDLENILRHTADLARIRLAPGDLPRLAGEIRRILDHVAMLSTVDTAGVEPSSPTALPLAGLRDDVAAPGLRPDEALSGAAGTAEGGFFAVPRAIREE